MRPQLDSANHRTRESPESEAIGAVNVQTTNTCIGHGVVESQKTMGWLNSLHWLHIGDRSGGNGKRTMQQDPDIHVYHNNGWCCKARAVLVQAHILPPPIADLSAWMASCMCSTHRDVIFCVYLLQDIWSLTLNVLIKSMLIQLTIPRVFFFPDQ